jgi:hypothetical protein
VVEGERRGTERGEGAGEVRGEARGVDSWLVEGRGVVSRDVVSRGDGVLAALNAAEISAA